jgi:hypothetical protein
MRRPIEGGDPQGDLAKQKALLCDLVAVRVEAANAGEEICRLTPKLLRTCIS